MYYLNLSDMVEEFIKNNLANQKVVVVFLLDLCNHVIIKNNELTSYNPEIKKMLDFFEIKSLHTLFYSDVVIKEITDNQLPFDVEKIGYLVRIYDKGKLVFQNV